MLNHITEDEKNLITKKSDLTKIFYDGCKKTNYIPKIGVEYEKISILKNSLKATPYNTIAKILAEYSSIKSHTNWTTIKENDAIIGLQSQEKTISLEPGSQTEISLAPTQKILDIKNTIDAHNKISNEIGDKFGIYWLGYGIQPVSTYKTINIIPKKRYRYMTEYLPTVAQKPLVMMRETAGIQTSFDYYSEEDAIKKLNIALKLSPITSTIFANSPIRNGKLTKYKSYRALSWLHTDNDRCGLVSSKIFKNDFSFQDYTEIALDIPMIFIERKINNIKTAIKMENLTFRQFMQKGYENFQATKDDWELHLSLFFPEVRLKNYLEIRNHDNQKSNLIPTIPAFWKGIIYNNSAIDEINKILEKLTYFDFEYLRQNTPKTGLNIKIKNHSLTELAKEIVNVSYQSLKQNQENEELYLEPIIELIDANLTPADLIINHWNSNWKNDISKLIEYTKI